MTLEELRGHVEAVIRELQKPSVSMFGDGPAARLLTKKDRYLAASTGPYPAGDQTARWRHICQSFTITREECGDRPTPTRLVDVVAGKWRRLPEAAREVPLYQRGDEPGVPTVTAPELFERMFKEAAGEDANPEDWRLVVLCGEVFRPQTVVLARGNAVGVFVDTTIGFVRAVDAPVLVAAVE